MANRDILMVSANRFKEPYPVYPLGISYLATYLGEHLPELGIDVFDFNLGSLDDFAAQISSANYRYICISLRNVDDVNVFLQNSFIEWYDTIIKTVRQHSSALVIIGGAGYSIFPKLLFDYLKPDFGIYSEGERALCDIITLLDAGADCSGIEGLVYLDKLGHTIVNARDSYASGLLMNVEPNLAAYYWRHSGMLNIQTKRGCPYQCIYCSYPIIEGRTVRTLDVDVVVDNIKELARQNMNYLFFTDSVFNICKSYNVELAQKIIDSGVKINWGAYFSPHNLDREELDLYRRSGLTHVEFGTESFSDSQLVNYGKNFTFADILTTSNLCLDLGIFYAHFLILGGYGETNASIAETIENSKKIDHSVFFPYFGMRIYPGTILSGIAKQEGLITSDDELINPTYYMSKDIDVEQIKAKIAASDGKWILPDDPVGDKIEVFRGRGRKGPLWEYLRYL